MNWTLSHIEDLKKKGKIQGFKILDKNCPQEKKRKRAKYRNEKVEYDGKIFDSRKEYNRYRELLLLLKSGEIGQLRLQVPYELNEGGSHSLKYIADFVYIDSRTGATIIEDTKGFKTKEYLKKKRLMKKVLGLTIIET